jgi:glycosyltransferase involved in cell wall biosynthesis
LKRSQYIEISQEQKKKILCIVQLPPPVHGASIMNDNLVNGEIVKKYFELIVINLQFLRSIDDISKFSFRKFFKAFQIGFEIIRQILINKPDLVYLTFAIKGFALYRDLGYAFLTKLLGRRIVFHLHEKGIKAAGKKSKFKKSLFRKAFNNEFIICISEKLIIETEDVYKAAPFIVPNGIRYYQPLKQKAESDTEHIPQILLYGKQRHT